MSRRYFNVIMPMGSDQFASTKQQLIGQVAQVHDLETHFPKYSLSEPAFDMHAIIEDLKESLFVIADLSLERPSCYYELGVAEAFGNAKRVYQCGKAIRPRQGGTAFKIGALTPSNALLQRAIR